MAAIIGLIQRARIVIADVSQRNPNQLGSHLENQLNAMASEPWECDRQRRPEGVEDERAESAAHHPLPVPDDRGLGQERGSPAYSIRTSNRNFERFQRL
jgi:hypothetical protein